jgi:hypothetical protein
MMKKYAKLMILGLLLLIPGCDVPEPSPQDIVDAINKAGPSIVKISFVEVPDQATAKKDAQFIATMMETDAIPFVTNSDLPAAQLIPQLKKLLGSKITNNLYVGVAFSVVELAVGNIDINAPSMTADEKDYVIASLTAIDQGCKDYLGGKTSRKAFFDVQKAHEKALKKKSQ